MRSKNIRIALLCAMMAIAVCVDLSYVENEFQLSSRRNRGRRSSGLDESLSDIKHILTEISETKYPVLEHGDMFKEENVFDKLGLYQSYPEEYWKLEKRPYQVMENPDYCNQVDLLNMLVPENLDDHKYTFSLFNGKLMNSVVSSFAGDDYLGYMTPRGKVERNIPVKTNVFVGEVDSQRYIKLMGNDNLCLTQAYSWIPGLEMQNRKREVPAIVRNYARNLSKQCFDMDKFYPQTFYLHEPDQCREFFKFIDTDEYAQAKAKHPVQFFVKTPNPEVHQGKGVQLMTKEKEEDLRTLYNDGELCDGHLADVILQRNIQDPLLIYDNNKFDFRVYVFVASVDPLIVYFYHDGWVRASIYPYKPDSVKDEDHLTNTHISDPMIKKIASKAERDRMVSLQLGPFARLSKDLKDKGIIDDEEKFISDLKIKFKRSIVHLMRMSQQFLYKHSGLYKFMGWDFMLTKNMDLMFIETNLMPQMFQTLEKNQKFMDIMHKDTYEIVYAYLRSRVKRLREFFKEAHGVIGVSRDSSVVQALKQKFSEINKNYLEPEFEIPESNGWEKVIDENLKGKEAYMGYIDDACFE